MSTPRTTAHQTPRTALFERFETQKKAGQPPRGNRTNHSAAFRAAVHPLRAHPPLHAKVDLGAEPARHDNNRKLLLRYKTSQQRPNTQI